MSKLNKCTGEEKETFISEDYEEESLSLKGPIISYGADYTLDTIRQYVDSQQIAVQPSFQRKFVWDIKKASKLIESFLLGYPIPNILLGRDSEKETMEVIDGQQRILSICDFFKGKFRSEKIFKLTGDKNNEGIDENFINKTYEDLDDSMQKKLKNSILKATILVYPKDDPNIKFAAFQRINTGSVVLNQQEIRNCIYGGPLNDLLFKINAENTIWRKLLSKKIDKRMKDIETILRFFTAYFNGNNYEKPITMFLNSFMEENKNITNKELEVWETLFNTTLKIAVENIGTDFPRTVESTTFNRAIFESVMFAIAKLNDENKLNKGTLQKKYGTLIKNKAYIDAVTSQTSDKKKYNERLEIAKNTLA